MSERGFAPILGMLLVVLLLAAIGVGIYLINHPTTLKSKADQNLNIYDDLFGVAGASLTTAQADNLRVHWFYSYGNVANSMTPLEYQTGKYHFVTLFRLGRQHFIDQGFVDNAAIDQKITQLIQQQGGTPGGNNGFYYILGNEPNLNGTDSDGQDNDINLQATQIHTLIERIRLLDKSAKIVSPSTLNWVISWNSGSSGQEWWQQLLSTYQRLYNKKPDFDILNIHLYSFNPPIQRNGQNIYMSDDPSGIESELEQFRTWVNQNGYASNPLWITEGPMLTCGDDSCLPTGDPEVISHSNPMLTSFMAYLRNNQSRLNLTHFFLFLFQEDHYRNQKYPLVLLDDKGAITSTGQLYANLSASGEDSEIPINLNFYNPNSCSTDPGGDKFFNPTLFWHGQSSHNGSSPANLNGQTKPGFWVDVSADNFQTWADKAVMNGKSTDMTGFVWDDPAHNYPSVTGPLLQPGGHYQIRINNQNGFSQIMDIPAAPAGCGPTLTPPQASCSFSPSSALINQSVTAHASATGGNNRYIFNWNGDLSGNTPDVSQSFTTPGQKSATATISSAGLQTKITCNVDIKLPPVKGDFNNDGSVGTDDLVILLSHFNTPVPANTLGDMNGDGQVDDTDFVAFYNLIK